MTESNVPKEDRTLIARFKKGDVVRWNALALHGDDRNGWTITGLETRNALLPSYWVSKGAEKGCIALQSDLEPCPTHARKQREMAASNVERCRNYDPRPPEGRTENEETIVILGEQVEQLRALLACARCPDERTRGHQVEEQCQWCYEREQACAEVSHGR